MVFTKDFILDIFNLCFLCYESSTTIKKKYLTIHKDLYKKNLYVLLNILIIIILYLIINQLLKILLRYYINVVIFQLYNHLQRIVNILLLIMRIY